MCTCLIAKVLKFKHQLSWKMPSTARNHGPWESETDLGVTNHHSFVRPISCFLTNWFYNMKLLNVTVITKNKIWSNWWTLYKINQNYISKVGVKLQNFTDFFVFSPPFLLVFPVLPTSLGASPLVWGLGSQAEDRRASAPWPRRWSKHGKMWLYRVYLVLRRKKQVQPFVRFVTASPNAGQNDISHIEKISWVQENKR